MGQRMTGSWTRIWHPPQTLQGRVTSSPTWQRRKPGIEIIECTPYSLIVTSIYANDITIESYPFVRANLRIRSGAE